MGEGVADATEGRAAREIAGKAAGGAAQMAATARPARRPSALRGDADAASACRSGLPCHASARIIALHAATRRGLEPPGMRGVPVPPALQARAAPYQLQQMAMLATTAPGPAPSPASAGGRVARPRHGWCGAAGPRSAPRRLRLAMMPGGMGILPGPPPPGWLPAGREAWPGAGQRDAPCRGAVLQPGSPRIAGTSSPRLCRTIASKPGAGPSGVERVSA
jgi:hypothetical protein